MLRSFNTLQGATVQTRNGPAGTLREFFFCDSQWIVRYFVVDTEMPDGPRSVLLEPRALAQLGRDGRQVSVTLSREEVQWAPPADWIKPVSRQRAAAARQHAAWTAYRDLSSSAGWGAITPPDVAASELDGAENPRYRRQSPTGEKHDPHLRSSARLAGSYSVVAEDGRAGTLRDFVVDDTDWQVPYAVVRIRPLFGRNVLVPSGRIEKISVEDRTMSVKGPRFLIRESPPHQSGATVSSEFETEVAGHYDAQRRRRDV